MRTIRTDGETRQLLTISIFGVSAVGILILAYITISQSDGTDRKENIRLVFAAVIPLLASWVGTVIAYYYSRENLAAATSSVTQLARVMGNPRLDGIGVLQKMIPKEKVDTLSLTDLETKPLKDVLAFLQAKGRQRLPVFDAKDAVKYIIHESTLSSFVSQQALAGKPVDKLTFKDLTADAKLAPIVEGSFVTVPKTATLGDAKQRMEEKKGTEDVFVTETGKPEEPVLGWLTDNMLSDEAKL